MENQIIDELVNSSWKAILAASIDLKPYEIHHYLVGIHTNLTKEINKYEQMNDEEYRPDREEILKIPETTGIWPDSMDKIATYIELPYQRKGEIFDQGWWAYGFGYEDSLNPYKDIERRLLWNTGWEQAAQDDEG